MRQEHLNTWNTYCGCRQSKTQMSEPLSSKTKELQAKSRQHLKAAVGLLTGHTTLTAHLFKLRFTQRQDCPPVWELKIRKCTYFLSLSGTDMQKIQNHGSYVFDAQGSRKHEAEWPHKPGSQYQAWHNTLTPF